MESRRKEKTKKLSKPINTNGFDKPLAASALTMIKVVVSFGAHFKKIVLPRRKPSKGFEFGLFSQSHLMYIFEIPHFEFLIDLFKFFHSVISDANWALTLSHQIHVRCGTNP
jgi:hypothetical protein